MELLDGSHVEISSKDQDSLLQRLDMILISEISPISVFGHGGAFRFRLYFSEVSGGLISPTVSAEAVTLRVHHDTDAAQVHGVLIIILAEAWSKI